MMAGGVAHAVEVTRNTCEGGSDSICNGGLQESVRTTAGSGTGTVFSFEGIGDLTRVLRVCSFNTSDDFGLGTIQKGTINIWGGGLGSQTTGEPTGSPNHAMDNIGPDELIVFQFASDAYIPKSIRIGWKGDDADIMTYIGGSLSGLDDILALFLAGGFTWDAGNAVLGSPGFVHRLFSNVAVGATNTLSNNAAGRYLILGGEQRIGTGQHVRVEFHDDLRLARHHAGELPNQRRQQPRRGLRPQPAQVLLQVEGADRDEPDRQGQGRVQGAADHRRRARRDRGARTRGARAARVRRRKLRRRPPPQGRLTNATLRSARRDRQGSLHAHEGC